MTLSTTQHLQIKRHLGEHPNASILDPLIATMEDGAEQEVELLAALSRCNTTEAEIDAVTTNATKLIEGGGAKFSNERLLAFKERAYRKAVGDLARIIGYPLPQRGGLTGFFSI